MEMVYDGKGTFRPKLGMPLELIRRHLGQDDAYWEIQLGAESYRMKPAP